MRRSRVGELNDIVVERDVGKWFLESQAWLLFRQQVHRTLEVAYERLRTASDVHELYNAQGMIRGLEWVLDFDSRLDNQPAESDTYPDDVRYILDG